MKYLGVLLISLSFLPLSVTAQDVPADDATQIANTVVFQAIPETPGPNTQVHLVIQAPGIDLDSSTETWEVNGTKLTSGRGITSIDFTTGSVGSKTTVTVIIDTTDSEITRSIDFAPGEVDLLWQGDTYTPPFYKGRAHWTNEGKITILAVPHVADADGNILPPSRLIFNWTKDSNVLGLFSGAGRDTITFDDSVLSLPTTVRVDVMTDQNTTVGTASIALKPEGPQLIVYEDNPLYGVIFGNAIGDTVVMKDKEVTFAAIPLYMSAVSRFYKSLSYSWKANGESTPQKTGEATFRAPDAGGGSTNLDVSVINTDTLLQSLSKSFLVQFGQQGI